MDKQTGKLIARIAENLPEMSSDIMQGWIENPKGMQKFLAGLNPPASEKAGQHDPDSFFRTRNGLYVWDDFRSRVVEKAESSTTIPASKSVLLTQNMVDAEIEKMLGDRHLFTETEVCALIADLIAKQVKGEEGTLLNNSYANLFYTSSCVVLVYWRSGPRRWSVDTWGRGGRRWSAGSRVFSPAN